MYGKILKCKIKSEQANLTVYYEMPEVHLPSETLLTGSSRINEEHTLSRIKKMQLAQLNTNFQRTCEYVYQLFFFFDVVAISC